MALGTVEDRVQNLMQHGKSWSRVYIYDRSNRSSLPSSMLYMRPVTNFWDDKDRYVGLTSEEASAQGFAHREEDLWLDGLLYVGYV